MRVVPPEVRKGCADIRLKLSRVTPVQVPDCRREQDSVARRETGFKEQLSQARILMAPWIGWG
jgi:hypothetical protein